jgi:hypothetical protein
LVGSGESLEPLPKPKPLPIDTVYGFIEPDFNVWGAIAGSKRFFLYDDLVFYRNRRCLAYPNRDVYLELERLSGMPVEMKVIRAVHDGEVFYVVLEVNFLE